MTTPQLPQFLLIGAPKSGTTSLYHYLKQHPQVWMPTIKEPHWFLFDGPEPPAMGGPHDATRRRELIQRWEDYLALFADCPPGLVAGEASIRYLYSAQACAAIKRRLPQVKLLAILRHPVDRAYSAYQRDRVFGVEPCATFAAALADCPRREREGWFRGIHESLGRYGAALAPWYAHFDRSQLRVYLYDDLRSDPLKLMRDLYEFIGADPEFTPDMSQQFNVTGVIKNPVLRFLWGRSRELRSRLVQGIPLALRGRLSSWSMQLPVVKAETQPLDPVLRAWLTAAYRGDILAAQDLIGRDLSGWLAGPGGQ